MISPTQAPENFEWARDRQNNLWIEALPDELAGNIGDLNELAQLGISGVEYSQDGRCWLHFSATNGLAIYEVDARLGLRFHARFVSWTLRL